MTLELGTNGQMEEFEDTVIDGLQQTWIEIKDCPVCCISAESSEYGGTTMKELELDLEW